MEYARNLWTRAGEAWCKLMHSGALWPIHGHYRCTTCLRTYTVPWEPAAARRA